jgi:mono/diheme cytochrome c family protein
MVVRYGVAVAVATVTLAFAAACGGGGDEVAAPTAGTVGGAPADLPGAPLYAQSCASCHGADLRGTDRGPSHLSIVYEPNHHPDDSFRSAVANGVPAHHWSFGDMDPVPGLSEADVDAIIEYVRAVQAQEGFEPYPPE